MNSIKRKSLGRGSRQSRISAYAAIVSGVVAVSLSACSKSNDQLVNDQNLVKAGNRDIARDIGDQSHSFTVLGKGALAKKISLSSLVPAGSAQAEAALSALVDPSVAAPVASDDAESVANNDNSLLLGIPMGLLGEQYIFGGVITQVSDPRNEKLGQLKLTDLSPIHARMVVAQVAPGQYVLALVGCVRECREGSAQTPLLGFPIVGVDQAKNQLVVDLAPIGAELDLVSMLDPLGMFTQLQPKASSTVAFDYSMSTLVFDIRSDMIPVTADPTNAAAPVTSFTTRWYLKLASGFNPAFAARAPRAEVGFFTTERSAQTKITRFSSTAYGREPVTYYLKNIPAEYQPAFKGALDEWNSKFRPAIGHNLIRYEFIADTDPRKNLLVTGDIRYNIIEWDLVNKAPYGGLGPSIANQFTGETISANVLIQGPTIIEMYKAWFDSAKKAEELRAEGNPAEADRVMVEAKRLIESRLRRLEGPKFELRLGKHLEFKVRSQVKALEDPIMGKLQFDDVPEGYTFEKYMQGYFLDMVAHEIGHNLGLRHNFRGNLGAADEKKDGTVSRSIMEYLGRLHRHLDHIGPYDVMAVSYGYAGKAPTETTWFCTDEDVAELGQPANSAECSRDDAENDPYAYFVSRLQRAADLLVGRNQAEAPVWTVADMEKELPAAVNGLALYAATAKMTASSWTNFFERGGQPRDDRPSDSSEMVPFVLNDIKARVCDATFADVLTAKADDAARTTTQANIDAFRKKVAELLVPYNMMTAQALDCSKSSNTLP